MNLLVASAVFGFSASPANAVTPSQITVQSSETISTSTVGNVLKVYLDVFRPNDQVSFDIHLGNTTTTTVIVDSAKTDIAPKTGIQFSVVSGKELSESILSKPIKVIENADGSPLVEIYPAPADFPVISYSGDTSLINSDDILSTPVVTDGTYAIDSNGQAIKFFVKSPNNLIGFRKLTDAPATPGFGGAAMYAYLEQADFSVSATSPGVWRLLDSNFQVVQKINQVKTKFGEYFPEGHEMTIAPDGNPVVITAVTRQVDSSWLNQPYKLPILDCDVAEIKDGVAIKEFSFWDWAVAHKSISGPLLNSMPLYNDPLNPKTSPIDVCHVNSMQYSKATNEYLISLRSPSVLMLLDANLGQVKQILNTDEALQHFARFTSANEITALGNFTLGKFSKFLDFKNVNGNWQLTQIPFPVHVQFCGNTQYLNTNHIWLAGGCGPFTAGVLGAIYDVKNGAMVQVGSVNMSGFTYSYRGDLVIN